MIEYLERTMEFSNFGKKFTDKTGILSLMDDMGRAMSGGRKMIMMGGGNPGHIPEFQKIVKEKLQKICEDEARFRHLVGVYSTPQGDQGFISCLANLLRSEYGWDVGPENICLTNGSQTGFFFLFNMFAGEFPGGVKKKIRLPLTPEYIGYTDIGLSHDFFVASRPKIDLLEDHLFKYKVDFEEIKPGAETGAICVSRPTNPTGNVVTDDEIARLDELARKHQVPLIIDNAYGVPFPGIVFSDAAPVWNENIVVCLSLSKLGLPAVRCGIMVARREVINAVSGMNAIMSLAPGSIGALLVQEMVETREVLTISNNLIRPFYEDKLKNAVEKIHTEFSDIPYRIHRPEGSMFLWLWFKGLPITSFELYQRLKKHGVLVISGHYFFPGLEGDSWRHKDECLRINYSQDEDQVAEGIAIIAREVRKVYTAAG